MEECYPMNCQFLGKKIKIVRMQSQMPYSMVELRKINPKEGPSFIVPSLVAREANQNKEKDEFEEIKAENILTDSTLHVENVMIFEENNKPNFKNKKVKIKEKEIKLKKHLFGTDLWFTGLGMSIKEL